MDSRVNEACQTRPAIESEAEQFHQSRWSLSERLGREIAELEKRLDSLREHQKSLSGPLSDLVPSNNRLPNLGYPGVGGFNGRD